MKLPVLWANLGLIPPHPNCCRVVEVGFVGRCSVFCGARAIGWLTAAARRTNQSAAARAPSAIRGAAREP